MEKDFYFIHPITASCDPRIEAMEEKLRGRGYGGYWYIREQMAFFRHNRCRLKDLKKRVTKYFTFNLMKTIIMESGLFYFEGEYIVAKELNSDDPENDAANASEKRGNQGKNAPKTRKTTPKQAKNDEKTTDSTQKSPKNSEKPSKNSGKSPKNDPKQPEKPQNSSENPAKKEGNMQKASTLKNEDGATSNTDTSIIYKEKEKETEIIVITEKGETAAAAADDGTGAEGNGASPGTPPPPPVRAWQQHLDALGTDSQWTEIACMKSGFGLLLNKHFEQAKEFFRKHVIAYGKGHALATEQDVTSYFMNFIVNPATSKGLRSHLQELEQSGTSQSADPYRHEQRLDGHRICNGHRIPDDAPPRPDAHSRWNDALHRWEPEYG